MSDSTVYPNVQFVARPIIHSRRNQGRFRVENGSPTGPELLSDEYWQRAFPHSGTVLRRPARSTSPRSLMASLSRTTAASSTTAPRHDRRIAVNIVEVVGAPMPASVTSGFRRGTDIVRALAWAQRPCVSDGHTWTPRRIRSPVERVLEILYASKCPRLCSRSVTCGTQNIAERPHRGHPVDGISREISASGGCYGP
jgi:hypothetical protein